MGKLQCAADTSNTGVYLCERCWCAVNDASCTNRGIVAFCKKITSEIFGYFITTLSWQPAHAHTNKNTHKTIHIMQMLPLMIIFGASVTSDSETTAKKKSNKKLSVQQSKQLIKQPMYASHFSSTNSLHHQLLFSLKRWQFWGAEFLLVMITSYLSK